VEGKTAAIGERDLILPLKAVGVDVFPSTSPEDASETARRLAREGYNIIMVTENLAASMQDVMKDYQNEPVPSIVPIPSTLGSEGFAMMRLREAIKRAVGTDILAEKE
jgi:V/A-type H+-transporting ATPase subunit F